MTDFFIKLPVADIPDPLPPQTVEAARWNDGADQIAYQYTTDNADPLLDWPAGASILSAWERKTGLQFGQSYDGVGNVVGTPTYTIQPEYNTQVRKLGNDNGKATGPIRSIIWQGAEEVRKDTAVSVADFSEYPTTNTPFTLQIERQDYGSTALPWDTNTVYSQGDFATSGGMWRSLQDNNQGNTPFGGSAFWEFINQSGPWGWVVFMLSDDPGRDITARAIGQYSDPEATSFLFTTGAFINDGKYGDVFYTECPPGNRLANPDPIYFALLLGAAQEGIFQLDAPEEGATAEALFWSADQP